MSTLKENLYLTIHRNNKPLKAIAEEIGMSENYLTRAALPDQYESDTGTGCRFPLNKLIPLIKATRDFSVLDCIERNLGRFAVEISTRRKRSVDDVCRATMAAVVEFGHMVGDVEKAYKDQVVTEGI